MGGESNLSFNADCEVDTTPTPPPVTGTLTVDTTYYTVDNSIITADQTDE